MKRTKKEQKKQEKRKMINSLDLFPGEGVLKAQQEILLKAKKMKKINSLDLSPGEGLVS